MDSPQPRMKIVVTSAKGGDLWWWEVQTILGRVLYIDHAPAEDVARRLAEEWIERRGGVVVKDGE